MAKFEQLPDVTIESIIAFANLFDLKFLMNLNSVSKKFRHFMDSFLSSLTDKIFQRHYSLLHYNYPRSYLNLYHQLVFPSIIIIGGYQDSRRCDIFFPANQKYAKCCGLSLKRTDDFSATYHKGLIFVISSSEVSAVGTVEVFDFIKNRWESLPALPSNVKNAASLSHNGILYVIGGYDLNLSKTSSNIFILNEGVFESKQLTKVETWMSTDHSLLFGRSHHAAISFDNCIWIAGGIILGQNVSTNSTEIYSPELKLSKNGPSMQRTRYLPHLLTLKSLDKVGDIWDLYVVGGDIRGTTRELGTIERLDRKTQEWVIVTTFPRRRFKCAVCAIGDHVICLIGGSDGAERLKSCDCYDIRSGQWSTFFCGSQDYSSIFGRVNGMESSVAVPITPPRLSVDLLLGH